MLTKTTMEYMYICTMINSSLHFSVSMWFGLALSLRCVCVGGGGGGGGVTTSPLTHIHARGGVFNFYATGRAYCYAIPSMT